MEHLFFVRHLFIMIECGKLVLQGGDIFYAKHFQLS